MRHRLGRVPLLIAALAPASLVLVHDLTFLAAYGTQYRAMLLATGHDVRWASTVTVVIIVSALLGAVGVARLGSLWLEARSLERVGGDRRKTDVLGYLRVVAQLWPWLALVTAVLFLGQENLEHAALGEPLPGFEPLLSGSSVPPILVLAAVTFLLAALGALFRWGNATLAARIAAALRVRRPALVLLAPRPPVAPSLALSSLISLNLGRRAPPVVLVS
jgi:hypothetical protein